MTCKILALVDSLGNLIKFRLMPGQYHDLVETKPLIEDVDFQALLADKAFDADWLIQELNERKVKVVIPPKSNRKVMRAFDTIMYKWRHLIENYFCKLKEFKRIAMRSCKTDTSFEAMKIEIPIIAPERMKVEAITIEKGQTVKTGQVLFTLAPVA